MMIEAQPSWQESLNTSTTHAVRIGTTAAMVFGGGFFVWAAFVPLEGSIVAQGTIAAAGRNIQIQHPDGGLIRALQVREGDPVRRGQALMVLDDVVKKSEHSRVLKQVIILQTRIIRLSAERDGVGNFDPILPEDPAVRLEVQDVLQEEKKEFDARLTRHLSERSILGQRASRLADTLGGLKAQKNAVTDQINIVQREVERVTSLLDKGLVVRAEYTSLIRVQSDLLGQRGGLEAEIAATQTQIAEAMEQIERQQSQRVEDAVVKLNEARASLADAEEQLRAASAVWGRSTITSPVDGIVVSSPYNTEGNVISPGEKVLEILPTTESPLIEARLPITDIDAVTKGQEARVRLVALNARLTPEVAAVVEHVSADRLLDEQTHEPYYRAHLRIDGSLPAEINQTQLHPGMPVEAYIATGSRTFLEYLIKPISDSMSLAFKEE